MSRFIKKINFKKIVIIYLFSLVVAFTFIIVFLGSIYKEKIKTTYNYYKLSEYFSENYNSNNLKSKINLLSKNSKDIIDIVILNGNDITYTTNNFYKNELTSINYNNNYYIDSNRNVYKLDLKREFILELFNIKKENKNDYYNNFQINTNNETYVINYLKNNHNNEKIIILAKISVIKNSEKYLKITFFIIVLFFMLYWIIVTLMIYQNALKLNINAYFWAIVTLLTNVVGVIIYLIFVKKIIVCKNCHANVSINDKYCRNCGEKI